MKINWKVRFKNPVFWATMVSAVIGFVYSVLGAFDVVPRIGAGQLENWIGMVITALTALGVLVDPTTSGVKDSDRAMEYTEPYDSKEGD